jgi:hypothetical protein
MPLPPSKHSSPQPPSSRPPPPTQQPTLSKSDARLLAWHRRMKPWYAAILTFTLVVGGVVTGAAGKEMYQRWRRERNINEIAASDTEALALGKEGERTPSQRPQPQSSLDATPSSSSSAKGSNSDTTLPPTTPANTNQPRTLHELTSSITSLQIRRHELLTLKTTLETKRERIRERIRLKEDEKSKKNSVARGVDFQKGGVGEKHSAEAVRRDVHQRNGIMQKADEAVRWDGVEIMGRIGPQGFVVGDVVDPSVKGGGGGWWRRWW